MLSSRSRVFSLSLACALGAFSASACKEVTVQPEGDDHDDDVPEAKRSAKAEFYAADAEYLQKNADFFFKVFDESFTRKLDELPQTGEVPTDKRPYSGGYYPEQAGGTDVVMTGGRSPLAKYDAAFNGGQNKAAAWEREKHTTGPTWGGHCNGFGAASTRHPKEPARDVVRNGVTFSPQDIKALMAEIYMSADYEFLGGNRCDAQGTSSNPLSRTDVTKMGECEDVNPGTMHAAVANWIGRMKRGLVMDQFRGDEVWNYPFFQYQVTTQQNISEAQARRYVTGDSQTDYVFNPNATRFTYIEMKLTYANATSSETLRTPSYKDYPLQYVLELNASGEIVGGEWVGSSQKEHPDFIWVPLEPMQPNGTRYMGNQYLDSNEVIKMWAESAGYDPNDPPKALKRPAQVDDWGKWPTFEVKLDGNSRGSVFAGKPTTIDITRRDTLATGKVELTVFLNGAEVKKVAPKDNEAIAFQFTPGPGLNRLQLTWRKDGAQIDDQYVRFHVVR